MLRFIHLIQHQLKSVSSVIRSYTVGETELHFMCTQKPHKSHRIARWFTATGLQQIPQGNATGITKKEQQITNKQQKIIKKKTDKLIGQLGQTERKS